jgi:hypothetical protein
MGAVPALGTTCLILKTNATIRIEKESDLHLVWLPLAGLQHLAQDGSSYFV